MDRRGITDAASRETGGCFAMTADADGFRSSLERLLQGADAALRTPAGDVAWSELARIIEDESAVLGAKVGIKETDAMRARVLADAECIRASIVAARALKGNAATNAQRRMVTYCQGMRSEIERVFAHCKQKPRDPGADTMIGS